MALVLSVIAPAAAAQDPAPTPELPELAPPFVVEADGTPIECRTGHAAPLVVDFDRDGLSDLAVGEFGGNLNPPVHGAGMKDQRRNTETIEALTGQSELRVILLDGREKRNLRPLSLQLDAQNIGHVAPGQGRIEVVLYPDTER